MVAREGPDWSVPTMSSPSVARCLTFIARARAGSGNTCAEARAARAAKRRCVGTRGGGKRRRCQDKLQIRVDEAAGGSSPLGAGGNQVGLAEVTRQGYRHCPVRCVSAPTSLRAGVARLAGSAVTPLRSPTAGQAGRPWSAAGGPGAELFSQQDASIRRCSGAARRRPWERNG